MKNPERALVKRLFLSPRDGRLRAGWRLLGQFILMQVLAILFGLGIGVAFLISPFQNRTLLAIQVVTFLAINSSIYLSRRFLDKRSFSSLGVQGDSWAWRDLGAGIALAGLMMALIFMIELASGWLTIEGYAWDTQLPRTVLSGVLVSLVIFILTGWQEELLSRGYQLQNLIEGTSLRWGLIISAIIFSILHLSNPNYLWPSFVGLVAAGLFLAYAYLRTRQLWLPIGLHIGWNFFEGVVFGFPVSGLKTFNLVIHTVSGPELLTGGAFGPEAGLVLVPALVVGSGLVHWYTRGRPAVETF